MPRQAAATREQYFEEANRQLAAGSEPTLASLCRALGGSNSTIGPILADWKKSRESEAESTKPPITTAPVPDSVKLEIESSGARVWAAALAVADERLATERAAMVAAKADLEAQVKAVSELSEVISDDLDKANANIDQLDAALKTAGDKAQQDAAQIELQAAGLARMDKDLAAARSGLEQAQVTVKQATDSAAAAALALAAEQSARAKTEQQAREISGELGKLQGLLEASQKQSQALTSQLEAVRNDHLALTAKYSEVVEQLKSMTSKQADTAKQLHESIKNSEELKSKNTEAANLISQLTQKVKSLEAENLALKTPPKDAKK